VLWAEGMSAEAVLRRMHEVVYGQAKVAMAARVTPEVRPTVLSGRLQREQRKHATRPLPLSPVIPACFPPRRWEPPFERVSVRAVLGGHPVRALGMSKEP